MVVRIRLKRRKKARREVALAGRMSLRSRLVLLIIALVTFVAVALSILHLDTLINTLSLDALDRSQRASQEVSSFLIDYLNQHASPTPDGTQGAKEEWYRIVSTDPDITSRLVKTMAVWPSLAEINVADQSGKILASSSERRVGMTMARLRDFAQWTKGSIRSRLVDLLSSDANFQVMSTLGIQGEPASVISIQVVISAVLLHEPVFEEVRSLALVSGGSLLAVLLITILATNFALRPLKRIDQTIDRIVQGNFVRSTGASQQPLRGAPKEFAVLENKLNLLGQQFLGARENATELRHDVDLLLERMASQLDVASRLAAISRLTGGVAHEIKNPLNAIALRLDFLRAKLGAPEEELGQDIDVLAREIARLDRVVKTFLDFSRPVEVHFDDVDLSALTREVADLMTAPARLAHVEMEVAAPESPVVLRGDADLLKQALLNLVTNAIEAMCSGGSLRLVTSTENGSVRLEVADTGPGIPAAQRDRVFQLYFTTKNMGSGIGLALTYRAVQLHNGTIAFDSEEGRGTTFRLEFPSAIRHV
jgi:signal transduction histidine kinase